MTTGDEALIYEYDMQASYQLLECRQKTTFKSFENKGHTDRFLRLPWCEALRILATEINGK